MTPITSGSAQRELLVASMFLFALLAIGTLGYSLIEHWYWLDSLYMTFITLTTIGFSEVHDLSDGGRFFTIILGLAGIGAVAFIATRSAQILLTGKRLRQRQMSKMIDKTKDHYILCGYGRIGSRIAQDLDRSGVPFVVIELSPDKIEQLVADNVLHVHGDAEQEQTLLEAGIDRAKGLVLTLPEDSANVFVTLVAREMNPGLFIMARTENHQNLRKLIRAGADKVVSPYEIGADRMAQVILRPTVDRFMERVLHAESLNLTMEEVRVEAGSPLAGKSLAEGNFRQRFDAMAVAIIDGATEDMQFNPGPEILIKPGDVLIMLGSTEMIARVRSDGCSAG